MERSGGERLALGQGSGRSIGDESNQRFGLARPLDRQPIVEGLVKPIEIGEKPFITLGQEG